MAEESIFLSAPRTSELWAAIKTQLALKVDTSYLEENYTTVDAVATAIATALTNYATDSDVTSAITAALADYMNAAETNAAIEEAVVKASGIKFSKVTELPQNGEENVIYLVPNGKTVLNNSFDEYMWIDGKWELMGSTVVQLTDYWSKSELRAMTSEELAAILV